MRGPHAALAFADVEAGLRALPAGKQMFTLPAAPESVGEARRLMRRAGAPFVDESRRADLLLVLSEVLSNAVRHGDPGGELLLAVTPKDDYLCVQVTDAGPGFAPTPRAHTPDDDGGWGLFLVEQFTRRWGLTREGARTRVWFEFDFSAPAG